MFRVPVTVKTKQLALLIPVLIEIRPNGGRIEWAPEGDPENISAEDSCELSAADCQEILSRPAVRAVIERAMRTGGARQNPDLKARFEKAERIG